jgi:hypothetical protein
VGAVSPRARRRPHVPYQVWFVLMWASATVGILAALGEYLGWFAGGRPGAR